MADAMKAGQEGTMTSESLTHEQRARVMFHLEENTEDAWRHIRALPDGVEVPSLYDALGALLTAHDAKTAALTTVTAELDALLAQWNDMVVVSGSKTHGGAVGHVAAMREERDRLYAQAKEWKRLYEGEKVRGDAWMADCKKAEALLSQYTKGDES